jgi:endonuclease YncB( thermonuclease family)
MARRLAPALGVAAVAVTVALPAPALAARGPCLLHGPKKPKCQIWTGKVGAVDDGDTINVNIDGDGTSKRFKIRLTGIQAMELHRYGRRRGRRGECNGVKAAERLEGLIRRGHSRVRLAALKASSFTGARRHRLRRSIAAKRGKGWVDVGTVLVEEGLALWFPNQAEWAWNRSYSRLAERAAARGRNVWNPESCRRGPQQGSRLRLKVKWNADAVDTRNVNGEWVRITNTDPVNDVSLARWWFRDSHLRRYTFPRSATVPRGGSIRLRIGRGRRDANTFFWGQPQPVFENVTRDRKQMGDGGYLFDPHGDLRAHVQYPCRTGCREPLKGRVAITARYRAPESIRIRNVSNGVIDLYEYEVESVPWFYEFARNTLLAPRQTLVLWVGRRKRADTPLAKSWGHRRYLLSDRRDVVTLRNPLGAPVTCHAWGGLRCPRF